MARYLDQLELEAQRFAAQYSFALETVYLGGGTPSFLRDSEMARLVGIVRRYLGWGSENTLEVNPGTVSSGRVKHWFDLGFNRASVGVQSLHDPTLKFLGRSHDAKAAKSALELLQNQGFRTSGDLITAVAGQPLEADIRGLLELGVQHVSAYTLTIEPGTPFAKRGVQVLEADEQAGFVRTAELLLELGFQRYEISNYAASLEVRSQHNLAYWNNRFYLGLGPGAAGHLPNLGGGEYLSQRYTNPHLHIWLENNPTPLEQVFAEDYATDALFMGLRLRDGISLRDLSARAGFSIFERYQNVLDEMIQKRLLTLESEQEGEQLKATYDGWWVLNDVIRGFLEG